MRGFFRVEIPFRHSSFLTLSTLSRPTECPLQNASVSPCRTTKRRIEFVSVERLKGGGKKLSSS